VAVICHDSSLEEERELVRAVGAAASIALENERLNAELRARVEELRASRARIVRAGDDERRRLERDLHDGAQQRLVALALNMRLIESRLETDPDGAKELLRDTATELSEATTELRELARGLHPAVLSDRGLRPALEALAGRAPLDVELAGAPDGRLPAPVESASYFVVAEALTNVARYAKASRASVSVGRANGSVTVEVRDDGVGGADPAAGSGLRGLADRVAALDGRLEVDSPPGEGTMVRAVIPCA
jgi:signal transduction histidine kinase